MSGSNCCFLTCIEVSQEAGQVVWYSHLFQNFPQQIWKTQQWPQDWKRSVFIPILKKGNAKECSHYRTIALISHTSKVMLKILQSRLQQYVNHELPDVQAGFRKSRGTRDQIANIRCITGKAREFQENIYFCFTVYTKAFDGVDHNKLWKILEYQMALPVSWETYEGQEATVRMGQELVQHWERNMTRVYIVTLLI